MLFPPLFPSEISVDSNIAFSKRAFDFSFSLLALVFLAPFILLLSVVILIREGGPVFFSQERVGHRGKTFRCLKFRTMVRDADKRLEELLASDPAARAEWDANQKLTNDPRVSCMGQFLRKTSLDEIPQFINVLRGEMSVVGPRPVVPDELHHYEEHVGQYKAVRPGITGAWQVSGRSNTTYAERVAMDVEYVENNTVFTDMAIVLKTVKVVLMQDGAR